MLDYYGYKLMTFTCPCGWKGLGSELLQGEMFRELAEFDCPRCRSKVGTVSFPTSEEVRDAAGSGNAEAIAHLAELEEREQWWPRVQESRACVLTEHAALRQGEVRAILKLEKLDEDHWLVLYANGIELHREVAAFEDAEPAGRLLAQLRDRFGPRLRSFDYGPALDYLAGDRLAAVGELKDLVAELPEQDGRPNTGSLRR